MSFLLSDQRDDLNYWARYQQYLDSVRNRFPRNAWELVNKISWHNFEDHDCPHDAWLEEVRLIEPASGENHEIRRCRVEVRLLGAYHDRRIIVSYPRVYRYSMTSTDCIKGLGDWRYDEFRLSEEGHLIHEIEWANGSRWVIEANDIEVQRVRIDGPLAPKEMVAHASDLSECDEKILPQN